MNKIKQAMSNPQSFAWGVLFGTSAAVVAFAIVAGLYIHSIGC